MLALLSWVFRHSFRSWDQNQISVEKIIIFICSSRSKRKSKWILLILQYPYLSKTRHCKPIFKIVISINLPVVEPTGIHLKLYCSIPRTVQTITNPYRYHIFSTKIWIKMLIDRLMNFGRAKLFWRKCRHYHFYSSNHSCNYRYVKMILTIIFF